VSPSILAYKVSVRVRVVERALFLALSKEFEMRVRTITVGILLSFLTATPALALTCIPPNIPTGTVCTFNEGSFHAAYSLGNLRITSLFNSSSRTVTDFHVVFTTDGGRSFQGWTEDFPKPAGPGSITLPDIVIPVGSTPTLTNAYFTPRLPEPQTWSTILMGFVAVGVAMRSRDRRSRRAEATC
jgi:hypothetical protein